MTGEQIRRALEQSLTLERGLLQLSGLNMTYDLLRPEMRRIVSLEHNGNVVRAGDLFTVAAPGFLAEGGDLYDSFAESVALRDVGQVSDVMIEYFRKHEVVAVPTRGRQKALSQ